MTTSIPTPFGDIVRWTTSDPQSLPAASAAEMTSVADAFLLQRAFRGTATERDTFTTNGYAKEGDLWFSTTDSIEYRYSASASWVRWSSDWMSFSPTWGNTTVGNGSTPARYRYESGLVTAEYSILFGTTTSFTGSVSVPFPVQSSGSAPMRQAISIDGVLYDSSASSFYEARGRRSSSTVFFLQAAATSGSYVTHATVNGSTPFAWADGDYVSVRVRFIPS